MTQPQRPSVRVLPIYIGGPLCGQDWPALSNPADELAVEGRTDGQYERLSVRPNWMTSVPNTELRPLYLWSEVYHDITRKPPQAAPEEAE